MHQSKKDNQWYFSVKAPIGVDAECGLVYVVRGTSNNVGDVLATSTLLHGEEADAFGDAGCQDACKRPDGRVDVN